MKHTFKVFLLVTLFAYLQSLETNSTSDEQSRKKRQFIDYDLLMDYTAYDYYDWVCTDNFCQVCDVLTGDCCDPNVDVNCFLPDSCVNNPCLSGGTCISTQTIDRRPDFSCVCIVGYTGKYCQLVDEFRAPAFVPPIGINQPNIMAPPPPMFPPPMLPPPPPSYMPMPPYPQGPVYPPQVYSQPNNLQLQPYNRYPSNYGGRFKRTLDPQITKTMNCDCKDKGVCAQISNENGNKINEHYCLCNKNKDTSLTYGITCKEEFKNPCLKSGVQKASAERSLAKSYFITCQSKKPILNKCTEGKIFDDKLSKCVDFTLKKNKVKV